MTERHSCGGRGAVPCPACTTQAAQAAYVAAWRAEHQRGIWGAIWACPLCGKAIQTTIEGAQYHQHDVEAHQQMHGADWAAYLAAGEEGVEGQ